jgi:predicted Rossmann fold nucleotide-binding protein DprA/Smf involved in DNA uptake
MIQRDTAHSGASRTQPVSQDRKDALLKLIQVEPDHIGNLTNATGWGEEQTRMTLMQLTVDGLVSRHKQGSVKIYKAVATEKVTNQKGTAK